MLEKFLNKEVIIEEKLYEHPSTLSTTLGRVRLELSNTITGIMTGNDDEFIELDNSKLISKRHIYRIMLK